jgi:hypothetical protein
MAVRACKVTCRDSRGIEHAVEVTAESLYHAVAHALRVFREDDWTESPERGPSTLVVRIKQPETEHLVRVRDFHGWLDSSAKSPAEMALKNRLHDILRR